LFAARCINTAPVDEKVRVGTVVQLHKSAAAVFGPPFYFEATAMTMVLIRVRAIHRDRP
jgi:hypothetical protein